MKKGKATLAKVRREVKKLGATIEVCEGQPWEYLIEAPPGFVWLCDGTIHELVHNIPRGIPKTPEVLEGVFEDILDRLKWGIGPCPTPSCEWCEGTLGQKEQEEK